MITCEDILQDLNVVKEQISRIPTKSLYLLYGKYHPATVVRKFGSWNQALETKFQQVNSHKGIPKKEHPCELCGKITKNSKYCSRSCSASMNNKVPKREKTSLCHVCGKYVHCPPRNASRNRTCRNCYVREQIEQFGDKKISDFSSTYARHRYQNIRLHAHRVAKFYELEKKCQICGYDKNVQLCHKKSIASFPKNTKLSTVNNIDKLVYLCPNHHWELDAGLLKLQSG